MLCLRELWQCLFLGSVGFWLFRDYLESRPDITKMTISVLLTNLSYYIQDFIKKYFVTQIWFGEFNWYLFRVKSLCVVWWGLLPIMSINDFTIPSLSLKCKSEILYKGYFVVQKLALTLSGILEFIHIF